MRQKSGNPVSGYVRCEELTTYFRRNLVTNVANRAKGTGQLVATVGLVRVDKGINRKRSQFAAASLCNYFEPTGGSMKDEAFEGIRFNAFPENRMVALADAAALDFKEVSNSVEAPKSLSPSKSTLYRRVFKRALDVSFVILTAPFSVPLILFCALTLWFEGGRPFYRQQRLGENGKQFSILKLRSMVHNADQVLEEHLAKDPEMRREWDTIQKLSNDPRITPVGEILRKTSLDELPQLWNVLRGDMSLVGPRPMMPEQLKLYGNPRAYFALKPGITGLWQVSARNSARFSYRNEVDSEYERSVTFGADLAILYRTVGVVLWPTGK